MPEKTLKGLFLAHRRELQAYLTEKLRDADVAADLTQETFLRYAEKGGASSSSVIHDRSYLYRTAHNLAIDHVRRRSRHRTNTVPDEWLSHIEDESPSQEDVVDANQKLEQLRAVLEELPERTRQVFALNRIEGLSYREVAEQLGISESSVQKHLASALLHATRRLRQRPT